MMAYQFSTGWKMLPGVLMLLSATLACATLAGGTPAGTQEPADSGAVQADVVFGPGAFNFPDAKAGLADLSSYTATLTLTFAGTQSGQSRQWSKTYVMLASKDPAARQLTIQTTGDIADLGAVYMAEVDGAAYQVRSKNACNATVLEPGNSLAGQLEPAGFLTGVIGAEEAGDEAVDGAAKHYTFDERAFGRLGLAESTGEMWVASDGGYVVKYLVTTQGNADYFGEGIEGTLSWDYELTGVNQPVKIELPADCPAGMIDAPRLADASNILNMPSMLTYETSSTLAEAVAFYRAQIPDLGWTPQAEPDISESTAFLDYRQGDQNLTVIITTGSGVTMVNILLAHFTE